MNRGKCRREPLTLKKKLELIECLKNGETRKNLSSKFKCSISTVSKIAKQENQLRKVSLECGNVLRKRMRTGHYEKIDNAMILWFREMKSKNKEVKCQTIKVQAMKFGQIFRMENFVASSGWLSRWKNRYNISYKRAREEKANTASVPKDVHPSPSLNVEDPPIDIKQSPPSTPTPPMTPDESAVQECENEKFKYERSETFPTEHVDDCDLFGIFVTNELRALGNNSQMVALMKRKIELAILETHDIVNTPLKTGTASETSCSNSFRIKTEDPEDYSDLVSNTKEAVKIEIEKSNYWTSPKKEIDELEDIPDPD